MPRSTQEPRREEILNCKALGGLLGRNPHPDTLLSGSRQDSRVTSTGSLRRCPQPSISSESSERRLLSQTLSARPELSQTQQLEPGYPKGAQHALPHLALCDARVLPPPFAHRGQHKAQNHSPFSYSPLGLEKPAIEIRQIQAASKPPKESEPGLTSKAGAVGNASLALVSPATGLGTQHPCAMAAA